MRTLILLCGLLPGLATGGSLYRCVDRAGHASYQSTGCPSGQRTDRTIAFSPEPVARPVGPRSATIEKRNEPKPRKAVRSSTRSDRGRKPMANPCEKAKAKRAMQLQRLGLKRTFDDLSRADVAVRAACNGF